MKIHAGIAVLLLFGGCATTSERLTELESSAPASTQKDVPASSFSAVKAYKRKIAVGRFSNETTYGRALLTQHEIDRLGKQTSDMLMSRLVKSQRFLVFERAELGNVVQGEPLPDLPGVDTLVVGSLTEFGRNVGGKVGFLSSTKVQTARAKVDIRLVDPRTGHAFFSATGTGEASTESGEIAGFGSRAAYDETLNDRAISAAISDVIDKLVSTMEQRPWRTDVLQVEGKTVYVSGGERQGLRKGDLLRVLQPGKTVRSGQSGFEIPLPPKQVALVRVVGSFGDSETTEGSVCEVVEGSVDLPESGKLLVQEVPK
jgi:curli biogenesis system outer membrane secretion channel CsgG